MSTSITCPTCKSIFNLEDVLTEDVEKSIKEKYEAQNRAFIAQFKQQELALQQAKIEFEQKKKQENELFQDRLKKEKELLQQQLEEQIRKQTQQEQAAKILLYEKQQAEQSEKIKFLQQKELEALSLQQQLADKENEMVHILEKQRIELERVIKEKMAHELQVRAEEKYVLKMKELEQKLEQQSKLIDEQKRKMEQGSMEQQGEIQENLVKERLSVLFPFDEITDVKKGSKGADLIQFIRNPKGDICGQIIYESKNTKNWSNEWIDKLIQDVREQKADVGVIISQALPKHIKHIGQEKSVWICGFNEFEGVAAMLRDAIIKIYESKQSQENKGDKMVMLYDYLNGNDFRQKWDAILNGFGNLKKTIEKQRNFYNQMLAEQDQIANQILINANAFLGDIKGISGNSLDSVKQLE